MCGTATGPAASVGGAGAIGAAWTGAMGTAGDAGIFIDDGIGGAGAAPSP